MKTTRKKAAKRAPRKTSPEAEQQKLWKRELRDLTSTQRKATAEANREVRKLERDIARIKKSLTAASTRRADRIATLKGRLGL